MSLRVKPDLHDADFYPGMHFRRHTGDRGMQMERSFRETGFNTYRVYSRVYVRGVSYLFSLGRQLEISIL